MSDLALRNTQAAKPNVDLSVIGTDDVYDMLAAFGASSDTAAVNTAASGTEILFTKTAGGSSIAFVSGRVPSGGFTLTSTFLSAWFHESNMLANCGGRFRVFKYTPGAPATLTEIAGGPFDDGVEFGTAAAEMTWTGNVTDTALAENDRLVLKVYITNVGTMAAGHTCTLTFNAASAATGDSFFQIAETVTFKIEAQAISPGAMASDEAFGSLSANFTLPTVGGLPTNEAFGSDQITFTLPTVGGLPSGEAFGALSANFTISGLGAIASAEEFGAATVSGSGIQTVDAAGQGIATGETFGAASANFTLSSLGAIPSDEAFGSAQVNLSITGVGAIVSGEAFGAASANFTVSATGIASAETFGADQVNLTLPSVGGLASNEAFGSGQVNLTISGAGAIASGEAFGAPALGSAIFAVGIASIEAFGSLLVLPGAVTISPAGIASDAAFGLLALFLTLFLPRDITITVSDTGELTLLIPGSGKLSASATQEAVQINVQ